MIDPACMHGEPRGPIYCPLCRRFLAQLRENYRKSLAGEPSRETGEQRREAGEQLALIGAGDWTVSARSALRTLADSGRRFTSEDLTDMVGLPSGDVGTNRNNAVGAVMSWAVRTGLVVSVGQTKSTRARSNAAKLSVYVGAQHVRKDGAA